MDIDLLRRAASKLRQYAQSATAAPWDVELCDVDQLDDVRWRVTAPVGQHGNRVVALEVQTPDAGHFSQAEADVSYAALMHPPVASALADLLDAAAKDIEAVTAVRLSAFLDEQAAAVAMAKRRHRHAIAVARAVLREDGA